MLTIFDENGQAVLPSQMWLATDIPFLWDSTFYRRIGLWFGGSVPANKVMSVGVKYGSLKYK